MNEHVPGTAASRAANGAAASRQPGQYLTFMLGGEVFAVGILSIKEILEYRSMTEVPMMDPCIRGVINLRGSAVPVMDLALRFGKPSSPVGKRTCIVILEVEGDEAHRLFGVVVDAVNEVVEIAQADVEPPPDFSARIGSGFIQGIGKINDRFVILLQVDRIMNPGGADPGPIS